MIKSLGRVRCSAACVIALSVSACGNSVEGASEDDIEKWLTLEGDAGFEVSDIDLVVSENTGSEVEPVWKSRADVEFELEEDFYKRVGSVGDTLVVEKVAAEGDTISGRMILQSEEKGDGEWDIDLLKNDIPWIDGVPASKLGADFVIEDSPEHEAALANAEQAREQEAVEARKRFTEAKQAFTGTWTSAAPLLSGDTVWSSNGLQGGYRLALEPSESSAGVGTMTFYDYANPSDAVTSPVGYNVAEDGEYTTVRVNKQVRHDNMRTYLANRTWRLTPDGKMTSGSYSVQLKK